MHARIDISEVELHTKIRAKYLRAIENEEWDLLPGPVYVRSFLKTYADYLGLDSRLLVDEFKRRYERPDQDPRAMASLSRERERPRDGRGGNRGSGRGAPGRQTGGGAGSSVAALLFSPRALIGVVLIAVVVALYLIGSGGGGSKAPSGNNSGHKTPPPKTHKHHHAPKTPTKTTPTHTTTTPKKPPAPTNATLALVPTGTVYVCVENAHGKALIPGEIFSQGDKIPTVSAKGLLVTLGNAGVQVTANGKSYPVTASTSAIAFKVTPTAVKSLTSGPTCEG